MPKGSIPKTTINLKMNSAVDDFDRMDGLGGLRSSRLSLDATRRHRCDQLAPTMPNLDHFYL